MKLNRMDIAADNIGNNFNSLGTGLKTQSLLRKKTTKLHTNGMCILFFSTDSGSIPPMTSFKG
jgi:hypothetical protein